MKEANSSQTLMLILHTTWHQISENHKHVLNNDYTKYDKNGLLELLQELRIMGWGHPTLLRQILYKRKVTDEQIEQEMPADI